ncbi:MAG TPA: SLC13 family permease [Xanthomonadales bacterium]|nr:SLC13 family permease [Xanthomonadales bacterium]
MGLDAILTLLVLLGGIVLFASEKLPVDLVAMILLAAVAILGLVSPADALSGFSSHATITVAAMFVLSAGLTRTGALRVVGRMFARIRNTWLFTLSVMVSLAAMSAFVNNTAALAVFLPVVLSVAASNGFSASKVLIPMSYAAQMGGVCTLIGTSTNLLVHALAQDIGLPGFSLFEFAPLGLITTAAGMVYIMIFGPILLPERRSAELTQTYELGKFITELRVMPDSPLIGQSVADAGLGEKFGVYVLELLRDKQKVWSPRAQSITVDDILLVRGDWKKINELKTRAKLELEPEFELRDAQFQGEDQVLAEVLITPGSRYVGHSLTELRPHWQPGSVVIAIQRRGEVVREKLRQTSLRMGDILLMLAKSDQMPSLRNDANLAVLSEQDEDSASPRGALIAMAIMVAVVGTAFFGLLPIVLSAILGVIAMVVFRCLDADEVYDAIDWRVIILLAGVIPLGLALRDSGAAGAIAQAAVALVGGFGPVAALAVIYLITATLTEAMSNNATAVLMTPIAVATAHGMDANATPFVVAVAFAASTSFATPIGYQTNTMVYSAGGYRFSDFVKIGVPMNVLFWAVAVYFIPRFWPL